jgi:DNA-binding NarL/FixJ family response regulator
VSDRTPELGDEPTERELEMLRLYERTGSHAGVASALGLSAGYVRKQLSYLYKKLGVTTAIQAAAKVRERQGLAEG